MHDHDLLQTQISKAFRGLLKRRNICSIVQVTITITHFDESQKNAVIFRCNVSHFYKMGFHPDVNMVLRYHFILELE